MWKVDNLKATHLDLENEKVGPEPTSTPVGIKPVKDGPERLSSDELNRLELQIPRRHRYLTTSQHFSSGARF